MKNKICFLLVMVMIFIFSGQVFAEMYTQEEINSNIKEINQQALITKNIILHNESHPTHPKIAADSWVDVINIWTTPENYLLNYTQEERNRWIKHMIIHEQGHQLYFFLNLYACKHWNYWNLNREKPVTEYGAIGGAVEDFAEVYWLYYTDNKNFQKNYPTKYKKMYNYIMMYKNMKMGSEMKNLYINWLKKCY